MLDQGSPFYACEVGLSALRASLNYGTVDTGPQGIEIGLSGSRFRKLIFEYLAMKLMISVFLRVIAVWISIGAFGVLAIGQTRVYRDFPLDPEIGFGLSEKFKVEVKTCSEAFKEIRTYAITPNEERVVTEKEHLTMFGFSPADGPVTIRVSLANGGRLDPGAIELVNKTYQGVEASHEGDSLVIEACQPLKQLMVRMPEDKENPLMIHVDPYAPPVLPKDLNVVTFDGGRNGRVHKQRAEWDRYTVPDDVDAVVIEDGALFKGTIHTTGERKTPLIVQGNGIIICREVSKPTDDVKMKYNALELTHGRGHKVDGITFVNGRHFAIRMNQEAHARNVKIYGYRANNDGIVVGADSLIENSFFKCNDDHIKIYYPRVQVRNCVFYEQFNGAIFQLCWNRLDPGDQSLIENVEVLEWEANCGDPDLGEGGIARSLINHRESEAFGRDLVDTVFRNIYVQPQIARFFCVNGLDHPVTYENVRIENVTLEKEPKTYSWVYAGKEGDSSTSIDVTFSNVRFGDRFIGADDFKTKGDVRFSFENEGKPFRGPINPGEADDCECK
ncbi:MAG: hypothetical protein AAGB46_03205 [Verrucomicrobiota bacterium]